MHITKAGKTAYSGESKENKSFIKGEPEETIPSTKQRAVLSLLTALIITNSSC